jgi:aspartyl aminopeptidase
MTDVVADLLAFLDRSPTPYHAVAECVRRLESAGFRPLDAADAWELGAGDRRYSVRGEGSLVAFEVGQLAVAESGFRWIGAHTDSPNLRLRPRPDESAHGYRRLGVEIYGSVLLHTWLDRDLSLAGRAVLRSPDGPRTVLVDFERPLLRVPNLAIHLQREIATEGLRLNPHTHVVPVLGLEGTPPLPELLAQELRARGVACRAEDVLSFDLMAYDTQPAVVAGARGEFVQASRSTTSPRVTPPPARSCARCARARSPRRAGSPSSTTRRSAAAARAARSAPLLAETLERIAAGAKDPGRDALPRALARSLLVSADMAHAVHPSFADKHDAAHRPQIGAGPGDQAQRRAGLRERRAHRGPVRRPVCARGCHAAVLRLAQRRRVRLDDRDRSALRASGCPTVDVGNPMLSMHSCREMAGAADVAPMIDVLGLFLSEGGG